MKKLESQIEAYIATFPPDSQKILKRLHSMMRKLIPKAEETISYGIPTFKLNGHYVVYFAGFKNHVSVYPIHAVTAEFQKKIAPYVHGKGTLRFALDKPIPYDLIEEVVKHLLSANQEKYGEK